MREYSIRLESNTKRQTARTKFKLYNNTIKIVSNTRCVCVRVHIKLKLFQTREISIVLATNIRSKLFSNAFYARRVYARLILRSALYRSRDIVFLAEAQIGPGRRNFRRDATP